LRLSSDDSSRIGDVSESRGGAAHKDLDCFHCDFIDDVVRDEL
jgi:hypothetical protein